MADKPTECGYTANEPVERYPSRSPSDQMKEASKTLGNARASFTMEEAQDLGTRVQKYKDAGDGGKLPGTKDSAQ